jgi:diguanylate cyclase (GGDEF)-like protein
MVRGSGKKEFALLLRGTEMKQSLKNKLVYLLLLVPTATEFFEAGGWPASGRDVVTDVVMTVIVLVFLLLTSQKVQKIEKLEKEVENFHNYDSLTGLPVRKKFMKDLEVAMERSKEKKHGLHLACIDIDHFKEVNEHYGSELGDKIIAELAENIKQSLPSGKGAYYRISGDIFAVLFEGFDGRDVEQVIAQLVVMQANSEKLVTPYKSKILVGTSTLSEGDIPERLLDKALRNVQRQQAEAA